MSADTKEEVDYWTESVRKGGIKIRSEPEEFGEEYYGFVFSNPDDHTFNVFML